MKKIGLLVLLAVSAMAARAQDELIKWNYTAKKIADQTYELHMTATVDEPWRVYSQHTPKGGPQATKFTFTKNPILTFVGPAKEVGKMEKKYEDAFGINVWFYHDQVDFVQTVKLKAAVKTSVTGDVLFMICNDEQCMPPAKSKFSIPLE